MTSRQGATFSMAQLLEGHDDAPAFEAEGLRSTRADLRDAAGRAAAHLARLGFSRGDVLAVWLPNGAAWLQLLFAAAHLGVLIVPISTRYKAAEVRHLLGVSRARGIVTAKRFLDTDHADIARGLKPQVPTLEFVIEIDDLASFMPCGPATGTVTVPETGEAADLLCCYSTSGTTGMPKLAAHGHGSIARHAVHVARALDLRTGDGMLCVLPLFGVFGFFAALSALAGGARCIFMAVFDAADAVQSIARHRITHFIGSDAMYDAMFKVQGADLRSLRRGVQGDFVGLATQVTRQADALGIGLTGVYGSSECYSLMSFNRFEAPVDLRARAGGMPVDPEIEVRVTDPGTGLRLPDGEPGEIQIRGPNVLAGYLNNPEATAKAMTVDGWFRSGDLGYSEGTSFVYLARMGDSLRLRGYLVNPAEIEACLMAHASVQGAQVVGVNRPGEGDIAVAFIIATGTADEAALAAHCRTQMAAYKVPRRIVVVEEFPSINGPNGVKIQKKQLRDMAQSLIG